MEHILSVITEDTQKRICCGFGWSGTFSKESRAEAREWRAIRGTGSSRGGNSRMSKTEQTDCSILSRNRV